ncbi:hypothetical protein RVM26_03545 [Halomonas sp. KM072]
MDLSLKTSLKGGYVTAEVVSDQAYNGHLNFAFYLYLDGVRESVVWYAKSRKVTFDVKRANLVQVKLFAKDDNGNLVGTFLSEELLCSSSASTPVYNINRWGGVSFFSFEDFISLEKISDGCVKVELEGGSVDFFIDGVGRAKNYNSALVCFSGAVPNRSTKSAPFFSGVNVAKDLDMPLISVSDPSLALSSNLALSWYAGNYQLNDLPDKIAKILDQISRLIKCKLILFGGSGGGFAVLSVIHKLSCEAAGAVWNPQVSITRYNKRAVENYLNICFPSINNESDMYKCFQKTGVEHDLHVVFASEFQKNVNVLYIQNEGDSHHMEKHAMPFVESLRATKAPGFNNVFYSGTGVSFWFGYWGEGHLVPDQEIIKTCLRELSVGSSSLEIARNL